jgi:dTDP-L-rhamnose 4-epimerase
VKKILITGGYGFIGQFLARKLSQQGIIVYLLDNLSPQVHGYSADMSFLDQLKNVKFIFGDVCDIDVYESILSEVDFIIHLAAETGTAQSMYEISRYNRVNSQGTAVLLNYLVNHPNQVKKFVLASSRSVYGEGSYLCDIHGVVSPLPRSSDNLVDKKWDPFCPICSGIIHAIPTGEDADIRPASIYAATKYAQEDLVRIACDAAKIDYLIFRFQNVYGEGQSLNNPYTGILSIFSTRIRQGLTIPVFEDGLESRDFVHVSDVVDALCLGLDSSITGGYTLNIGSGKATSILEISHLLFDVFNGSQISFPQVSGQYRFGDIRHCYADLSNVQRVLDWTPKISLRDGLNRFAEWVRLQPVPSDGLDSAMAELRRRNLTE